MSGNTSELYDLLGPFTGIPNRVFRILPLVGHKAFILYICLRCHAGRDEVIFPSYDLISAETGLHRRDIAKGIRVLESFGLIERKRRFGRSTIYKLLYLTPESLQAILDKYGDPLEKAKPSRSNDGTTDISANGGTTDSTNGGTVISTNGGTLTRINQQ